MTRILYSYGLGSNGTTILSYIGVVERLSYVGVVERLKVNEIVFGMSVFEMRWHEGCGHVYIKE